MRAHRGQVALYLIAVLIAICVLTMTNVGIYLAVSAKNRAMNAGDAAALAAAKIQGELLNRIGQMNIEHLKAAIQDDDSRCREIMTSQLRCCFLGPMDAIPAANAMARENGAERQGEVESLLRVHARDVRKHYATNIAAYPEPWEGAWSEYALALELAANRGIWAGPDNICFVDTIAEHFLINHQFYNAIAGRSWCWFKFNARGLLDSYSSFLDWGWTPADWTTRRQRCVNCEVYSLHLNRRVGSAMSLLGMELICRLTGASESDVANSSLINDPTQAWMFYDESVWRAWREIDPFGDAHFPVAGTVRREYDVLGCAARCRVIGKSANLLNEGGRDNEFAWTAGAKPFGTVLNDEGVLDVVTANGGLVTPAFDRCRLVPIDAVGGQNLSTADPDQMTHVRDHLPTYLQRGPGALDGGQCWYCQQLQTWENASFRQNGAIWLQYHAFECVRPESGGNISSGGTAHGH